MLRSTFIWLLCTCVWAVACESGTDTLRDAGTAVPSTTRASDTPRLPSPTLAAEAKGRVDLAKHGFSVANDGTILYAFLVINTDTSRAFESTRYQVSFYDAAGQAVASDSGSISVILPLQTAAVGDSLSATSRPARMEVALSTGQAREAKGVAKLEEVPGTYSTDRFGSARVLATLRNPYSTDLKDLYVVAVLFDAQGNILGGDYTYHGLLPASGQAAVNLSLYPVPPQSPTSVTVYASISSLTLLDLQANRPTPKPTAPQSARLSAALITLQDLPTGWSVRTSDNQDDDDDDICGTSVSRVGKPIEKAQTDFEQSTFGPLFSHTISFYAKGEAKKSWDAVIPTLRSCKEFTSTDDDGTTTVWTASSISFPKIGDESYAMRISTNQVPLFGSAQAMIVFFRRGEYITSMSHIVLGPGGTDTKLLELLAKKAEDRLGKIPN